MIIYRPIRSMIFAMLVAINIISNTAFGATDMFLYVEGVEGESTADKYSKWIDVLAWGWQMSQLVSSGGGGGTTSARAEVGDLVIRKYIDSSTPHLMLHLLKGQHISKVELVLTTQGGEPVEYFKVTLENVLISSIGTGGSGAEVRLTETLTFNFAKVTVTYKTIESDGSPGAVITKSWNIETNTEG